MNENEIKNILEEHQKWLANDPDGKRADLYGADLSHADLSVANLSYADLRWADLSHADLSGADLSYVDLRDTNLHDADLRDANLSGADLRDANLRDADLRDAVLIGADLDYSCWPLWCGSLDVKVDEQIVAQLAYHFCRLNCDSPKYQEAREALKELANQFHRVDECGRIENHT